MDKTSRVPFAAASAAILSSILFSGKGILTKTGMTYGMSSLDMLALRMGLAAPIYAAILVWSQRRVRAPKALFGQAILLGLLGTYLSPTLNFMGLQTVSASLERILIHAIPAFVMVVAALVGTEKLNRVKIIALAICYGGVTLSCLGGDHGRSSADTFGVLAILAGCLIYAVFLVKSVSMQRTMGTVTFTSTAMLASTLACVVQNLITGRLPALVHPPPGVLMLGAALALFCTVLPVYLSAYGISKLGAGRSSTLNMFGPLFTPIAAACILGERMGMLQIAGFLLVFAGGILLSRSKT